MHTQHTHPYMHTCTYMHTYNIHIHTSTHTHEHTTYRSIHAHTEAPHSHAHMHNIHTQRHAYTCPHAFIHLSHMHKQPGQKKKRRNKLASILFLHSLFFRPPGGELLIDRPLNAGGFPVIEKDFLEAFNS